MTNAIKEVPTYYRRLSSYFPVREMKHPQQLHALVLDQPYYHKLETPEYVVLYAELETFVFVDYLLVSQKTRSKGIGSKVIEQLKTKGLPILVEVEKPSKTDPDTMRRRKFYYRHGFRRAPQILYRRRDGSGKPFEMDILYWSPERRMTDQTVLKMMTAVCQQVHNHQAAKYYENTPADPEKVLSLVQE